MQKQVGPIVIVVVVVALLLGVWAYWNHVNRAAETGPAVNATPVTPGGPVTTTPGAPPGVPPPAAGGMTGPVPKPPGVVGR